MLKLGGLHLKIRLAGHHGRISALKILHQV